MREKKKAKISVDPITKFDRAEYSGGEIVSRSSHRHGHLTRVSSALDMRGAEVRVHHLRSGLRATGFVADGHYTNKQFGEKVGEVRDKLVEALQKEVVRWRKSMARKG